MTKEFKPHVPYLYLTRDVDAIYHLFIAIFIEEGYELVQEVHSENPIVEENILLYNLIIRKNAAVNSSTQFWHRTPINPDLFDSEVETPEIHVVVTILDEQEREEAVYNAILNIADSDHQAPNEIALAHNIAFNCPYLFLLDEGGIPEEQLVFHQHQCFYLIPVDGNLVHLEYPLMTSPYHGICEHLVVLRPSEEAPVANNEPGFHADRKTYVDNGKTDGNAMILVITEESEVSAFEEGISSEDIHHILKEIMLEQLHEELGNAPTEDSTEHGGLGIPSMGIPTGVPSPIGALPIITSGKKRKTRAKTRNKNSRRRPKKANNDPRA